MTTPIKPVISQTTIWAHGHHIGAHRYALDGIGTLLLFVGPVQICIQGIPSAQAEAIAAACEAVDAAGQEISTGKELK